MDKQKYDWKIKRVNKQIFLLKIIFVLVIIAVLAIASLIIINNPQTI